MDIKEAMDFWSEWYSRNAESWEERFARRRELLYRELIRRAHIPAGSQVLDIGTGTGGAAFEALEAVGASGRVVGIDNSEGMLRVARERAAKIAAGNIEFFLMDMSSLQFPGDSFDQVISSLAIYSSFPQGVGLREAYRALRKGGKLTFSMFGKHLPGSSLLNQIFGIIFEKYQPRQPSELLRRARDASELTYLGIMRYGPLSEPSDPSAVLGFMRGVGFHSLEAHITHHRMLFHSIDDFVDDRGTVFFPIAYAEMTEKDQRAFIEECRTAMRPLVSGDGVTIEVEVMFYSGTK